MPLESFDGTQSMHMNADQLAIMANENAKHDFSRCDCHVSFQFLSEKSSKHEGTLCTDQNTLTIT